MSLIPLYQFEGIMLVGLEEDHIEKIVQDSLLVQIDIKNKSIHSRSWSGQKLLKFGYYHSIPNERRLKFLSEIKEEIGKDLILAAENLLINPSQESIDSLIWVPERLK